MIGVSRTGNTFAVSEVPQLLFAAQNFSCREKLAETNMPPPGGHIKIGESAESGLIREFAEETGARIVCRKLLWTEESRFSCCGKMYHYITFYYLADPVGGSDIPDTGSPFPQMDNSDVLLEWIPVSRLGNITIHPSFLKDEIGCTDGTLRHFVSIE